MFLRLKLLRICKSYLNKCIVQFARYSRLVKRPNVFLALSSAGFSFSTFGVSDDELVNGSTDTANQQLDQKEKWEWVYEDENITVYRRLLYESGIYEFKCVGTYNDITPMNFVDTQCDIGYRAKWDDNVVSLDVLEEDDDTDSQVISWVTQFPYPMYARQYIYVRRKQVDSKRNKIVVVSKALDRKRYPDSGKYIRVVTYQSKLVVRAHKSLNEKGLDYVLIYYDDPKSSIPTMAYNWIVNRGGPYFMKKIHVAALERAKRIDAKRVRAESELGKRAAEVGDSKISKDNNVSTSESSAPKDDALDNGKE